MADMAFLPAVFTDAKLLWGEQKYIESMIKQKAIFFFLGV